MQSPVFVQGLQQVNLMQILQRKIKLIQIKQKWTKVVYRLNAWHRTVKKLLHRLRIRKQARIQLRLVPGTVNR